ncbi:MAG: hypothetical protein GYB68_07825 [Chloroflexi bacterium]|nr:hypothetical protein [Chloroflexota bacterium]
MSNLTRLLARTDAVFEFAAQQLQTLTDKHPDQFPMYTESGKWSIEGERWTNWCEGFLGGQLWLIYLATGDETWRTKAEHYSKQVEERVSDDTVHDLGFVFWPTYYRWWTLSDDQDLLDIVIRAGRTLASRYQAPGAYVASFVGEDSLFIDIMMNVGLIFFAGYESGDPELIDVAMEHSLTSRRHLVRGDGSTAHEALFDRETGAFLKHGTHQGWRPGSSWARGLAWALYGFGTVFSFTGDGRFLQTAQACANYFIEHSPDNGIPPNDFIEPNPARPYESSAAAIAASGLLQLSELSIDPAHKRLYHDQAVTILTTLTEPEFLASETPNWEGILKHGVYHERKNLGVDESVMWGDYFFLEALWKLVDAAD